MHATSMAGASTAAVRSNASLLVLSAAALILTALAVPIQAAADDESCGIWLGPSSIKESEEHGWGHSMFTGKLIKEGSVVLGSGVLDKSKNEKVFGDLFVPVFDWEALDMAAYSRGSLDDDDNIAVDPPTTPKTPPEAGVKEEDPPIFQQLWNGEIYDTQVLESYESMRVYIPGLSIICPCTSGDFNLEQIQTMHYRDWRDIRGASHDETPPSPQAGSFSYLSNSMFVATRDILPGEELVVECADNSDDFDPKDYPPVKFQPSEAGGYSICMDDRLEERLADHTPNVAGGSHGGQRGLFAKKTLGKGEILTSTPMVPVHQEEMTMDREKYKKLTDEFESKLLKTGLPPKKQQLLVNYMFGHPDSTLMWLPTGPLLYAVNHATHDDKTIQPNAKIQWHSDQYTKAQASGKPLTRRQEFHHDELLEMDSLDVAQKHGMGLMVDLVATRTIREGEEVLIDYGKAWDDAMKQHKIGWSSTVESIKSDHARDKANRKQARKKEREQREMLKRLGNADIHVDHKHRQKYVENSMTAIPLSSYVTASDFNDLNQQEDVRTVTEQHRNPYPANLETACYFEMDWLDEDINEDEEAELVTYESWYNMEDHIGCVLPCIVTERREYVPGEEDEVRNRHNDDDDDDYLPALSVNTGEHGGSAYTTRYTAKLVDTHEENTSIGFDCHIYKRFEYIYMDIPREGINFVNKPHSTDHWIEKAFRQPIGLPEEMVPQVWRDKNRGRRVRGRKTKNTPSKPKKAEKDEDEEEDYQFTLKRWVDVESRREKLEETEEKRSLETPEL